MSLGLSNLPAAATGNASISTAAHLNGAPVAIDEMFKQILAVVQKSNQDIADLRQETLDLRHANANLERQLRDSIGASPGPRQSGFSTPPTGGSPLLRAKSAFIPTLPTPLYVPSRLGDSAVTQFPFPNREIPGFWSVVPAGGAGTRLWPLSRQEVPKFFLDLTNKGRSLIQSTWDRLLPLTGAKRLMVVTGTVHAEGVNQQLPELLSGNLLAEPSAKESMGAIGLAAAILSRRDPEAVLGSFAADHMISGDDAFLSAVAEAVATAKHGHLVTIGIAPSHPATGFGYIRLGDKLGLEEAPNARQVSQFKEKPDARTAAAYLATGNYRWNGGMFVVKAKVLMELLDEYEPELHDGLEKIAEAWENPEQKAKVLAEVWPKLPKIAIDNAVAEPAALAGKVAVIPATFGWDDVGDFGSLADLLPAEPNQPRILGRSDLVVTEQVAGGIIVPAAGRRVACLGVDDLVIVDTADALLVTTRARSQEVKRLVSKCKDQGWKDLL